MTTTAKEFQNHIGGKWQSAQSGKTFPNHNPATGEIIGHFPLSGKVEIDAAVAAARSAFEKWRLVPAPKRGEILYRVGELLTRHKEDLARTMTQEMGKVLKETRGDVQEGIDMAYYMGGEGRRLFGYTVPVELPNKSGIAMRFPRISHLRWDKRPADADRLEVLERMLEKIESGRAAPTAANERDKILS